MENKKMLWIIGGIVVFLGVGAGVYFGFMREKEADQKQIETQKEENAESENPAEENIFGEEEDMAVPGESSGETPDEEMRQATIDYFLKNLNTLVVPPSNDKWEASDIAFYFVGNSHVYAELYPIETDLGGAKVLYEVAYSSDKKISLKESAKYKEAEEEWILISGKDEFEKHGFEEYGFNEETEKWSKVDLIGEMDSDFSEEEISEEEETADESEEDEDSEDEESEG